MQQPNLVLLYVKDPAKSSVFYQDLFGKEPTVSFPTYVAFTFDNGLAIGLWSTQRVSPTPPETGNRSELAFMVEDTATVESLYADWKGRGVSIEQEIMTDVFGRTFVALDPDGHRLRVCIPDKRQ
jgi:predicted enzyme related to lactoylglutathione lyase